MKSGFKILETPRDALQSISAVIPTSNKVDLLKAALNTGFDVVDIGSFVSPKIIPQFADMAEVLKMLDKSTINSKVFMLTGNIKGALLAADWDLVDYIGFPFSLSPTFLKRNINATIDQAWQTLQEIHDICEKKRKNLWIYFSMGFGNPYGDPVDFNEMLKWAGTFHQIGIKNITLSDITAVSSEEQIASYYQQLSSNYPEIEFGLHLHVKPNVNYHGKLKAAHENGCIFFDGVTGGVGGCPMTGYEMLTNLPTKQLIDFAKKENLNHGILQDQFHSYQNIAFYTFNLTT